MEGNLVGRFRYVWTNFRRICDKQCLPRTYAKGKSKLCKARKCEASDFRCWRRTKPPKG
ncbi:MAG: hypothetical protein ACTS4U_01095 [Candidatus Hodgkinia cicadicola]